jgi:hypothetical protein
MSLYAHSVAGKKMDPATAASLGADHELQGLQND